MTPVWPKLHYNQARKFSTIECPHNLYLIQPQTQTQGTLEENLKAVPWKYSLALYKWPQTTALQHDFEFVFWSIRLMQLFLKQKSS